MSRHKLNTYCEFPRELDMKKYTHKYIQLQERLEKNPEEEAGEEDQENLPKIELYPEDYY